MYRPLRELIVWRLDIHRASCVGLIRQMWQRLRSNQTQLFAGMVEAIYVMMKYTFSLKLNQAVPVQISHHQKAINKALFLKSQWKLSENTLRIAGCAANMVNKVWVRPGIVTCLRSITAMPQKRLAIYETWVATYFSRKHILFNSIQFNSIQFNPIQFNSIISFTVHWVKKI